MKINHFFSVVCIAFFAILLILTNYGCSNTGEQNKENNKPVEMKKDTTLVTSTVQQSPGEERGVETKGEVNETPSAVDTKPSPPAATEKTAIQKNAVKKPAETTGAGIAPIKKTEATPSKPAKGQQAVQTVESNKTTTSTTTAPVVKKEEPAPPPQKTTQPVVEQPKPAAQPTVTESPKSEEVKKETTTQPSPKPSPQTGTWTVPESANSKANPIKADKNSLATGKTLWTKHCASCHGKSGLGDGPKAAQLDTPAGDFSSALFQKQTDGALFYKTDEGKGEMPGFKKKIPDDEDIWSLVNYMRSFK